MIPDPRAALEAHRRMPPGQRYTLLVDDGCPHSDKTALQVAQAHTIAAQRAEAIRRLLRAAPAAMTTRQIASALGIPWDAAAKVLAALLEAGEVEVSGWQRVPGNSMTARAYRAKEQ